MKNENCREFLNLVASTRSTPSGGAVIGYTGALAASLAEMVANLAVKNKKYALFLPENEKLSQELNRITDRYLDLINLDEKVFSELSEVYKLPHKTTEEQKFKTSELNRVSIKACEAPINMISLASKLSDILKELTKTGSQLAISDVGVSAVLTSSVIRSSWLTIEINKKSITDKAYIKDLDSLKKSFQTVLTELDKIYIDVEKLLNQ